MIVRHGVKNKKIIGKVNGIVGVSMTCDGKFSNPNSGYSVVLDDDGRVAYAYLLNKDGAIVSDVWLYNRCLPPSEPEWKNPEKMPFANPIGFVKAIQDFSPIQNISEVSVQLMQSYPLSGVCFSLDENDDESGMGVDLVWFTAEQMIEEALSAYPGKVVLNLGYLPFAACLVGSGDPYFLKMKGSALKNPTVVRIPHDLVAEDDTYQKVK